MYTYIKLLNMQYIWLFLCSLTAGVHQCEINMHDNVTVDKRNLSPKWSS